MGPTVPRTYQNVVHGRKSSEPAAGSWRANRRATVVQIAEMINAGVERTNGASQFVA